jgi:hypothetical protein
MLSCRTLRTTRTLRNCRTRPDFLASRIDRADGDRVHPNWPTILDPDDILAVRRKLRGLDVVLAARAPIFHSVASRVDKGDVGTKWFTYRPDVYTQAVAGRQADRVLVPLMAPEKFGVFGNYRGIPQHLVLLLVREGFMTFEV